MPFLIKIAVYQVLLLEPAASLMSLGDLKKTGSIASTGGACG
ncbi:MAG: hypothetical protein OWQ48_01970 [Desulfurococcus sp.]|nr:hypothetical protein [Desulfurococcus sp.]